MKQENQDSSEGEIFVGPWGCTKSHKGYDYKPKGGIKTIIVSYGEVINSIRFVEHGSDEASPTLGGDGGCKIAAINIEYPSEYLTGISGYQSLFPCEHTGSWVIDSLSFQTNERKHGPIGPGSNFAFSFPMSGGKIVGFHVRAEDYLSAIGVYVKPICPNSCTNNCPNPNDQVIEAIEIQEQVGDIKSVVPRDPRPWCGKSGTEWDDGVFSGIKQIRLHFGNSRKAIQAIQFEYVRRDGRCVWMPKHGIVIMRPGVIVKNIEIDHKNEFLTAVDGFYGPIDGYDVIRSITFYSNRKKYGPFGNQFGSDHHFTSPTLSRGKVVGFHGSSGSYLNSIGVHLEYY